MKYLYLALAILFEVVGSGFLKASDGFSKIVPTGITLVAYLICFYFCLSCPKTIAVRPRICRLGWGRDCVNGCYFCNCI